MSGRVQVGGARVVITGAGSGIGAATARRFAEAGAKVVAVDIDPVSAAATAERCGDGARYQCDVADAAAVHELAATVEREHGPVDVLVNNAGVGVGGSLLETTARGLGLAALDQPRRRRVRLPRVRSGDGRARPRPRSSMSPRAAAYLPQPEHGRLLRHQGGGDHALPVPARRLGGKAGSASA